jgi:hypothetical protein
MQTLCNIGNNIVNFAAVDTGGGNGPAKPAGALGV